MISLFHLLWGFSISAKILLVGPNCVIIWVPSNYSFFQYCFRNFGLFSIAPSEVNTPPAYLNFKDKDKNTDFFFWGSLPFLKHFFLLKICGLWMRCFSFKFPKMRSRTKDDFLGSSQNFLGDRWRVSKYSFKFCMLIILPSWDNMS